MLAKAVGRVWEVNHGTTLFYGADGRHCTVSRVKSPKISIFVLLFRPTWYVLLFAIR